MKSHRRAGSAVVLTPHEALSLQAEQARPKMQYRTHVVKSGQVKLKISTDSSRPEFFLTDGVRFKEVFAVLSRTEKHAENQWVLHRCQLFFYQRAEDHDAGNDPLVWKTKKKTTLSLGKNVQDWCPGAL